MYLLSIMANTSSAIKAARQNEKRRLANKSKITEVRTTAKKVELQITKGSKDEAMQALKLFEKTGMKAVSKGLFHINTISRRISRLYARIKSAFDGQKASA
jgi:small subunit ribosomal protein S20